MTTDDELLRVFTIAMREADIHYEHVGGGTHHYIRDCLLPMLAKHGLAIVREHDGRDAERYRWLRDTVRWSYPSAEGSDDRDAYLVITGYDFRYGKPTAGDVVDAAVDEAIARGKE